MCLLLFGRCLLLLDEQLHAPHVAGVRGVQLVNLLVVLAFFVGVSLVVALPCQVVFLVAADVEWDEEAGVSGAQRVALQGELVEHFARRDESSSQGDENSSQGRQEP